MSEGEEILEREERKLAELKAMEKQVEREIAELDLLLLLSRGMPEGVTKGAS